MNSDTLTTPHTLYGMIRHFFRVFRVFRGSKNHIRPIIALTGGPAAENPR